jgi:hypothetical protein
VISSRITACTWAAIKSESVVYCCTRLDNGSDKHYRNGLSNLIMLVYAPPSGGIAEDDDLVELGLPWAANAQAKPPERLDGVSSETREDGLNGGRRLLTDRSFFLPRKARRHKTAAYREKSNSKSRISDLRCGTRPISKSLVRVLPHRP